MRWRTKAGEEMEAQLGQDNTKDITSQAWRTALDPNGDWIPAVLRSADRRLTEVRETVPDAGGLVIATDQTAARAYAAILEDIGGEKVTVVLSDEAMGAIADLDPEVHAAVVRDGARWTEIDVDLRGRTYTSGGHGFTSMTRTALITLMQQRAEQQAFDQRSPYEPVKPRTVADLDSAKRLCCSSPSAKPLMFKEPVARTPWRVGKVCVSPS